MLLEAAGRGEIELEKKGSGRTPNQWRKVGKQTQDKEKEQEKVVQNEGGGKGKEKVAQDEGGDDGKEKVLQDEGGDKGREKVAQDKGGDKDKPPFLHLH